MVNAARVMTVKDGGTVEFPVANQKISGSSTSTGSFGDILVGATGNSQLYSDFSSSIQSRIADTEAGGVTGVTAGTGISGGGSSKQNLGKTQTEGDKESINTKNTDDPESPGTPDLKGGEI